MKSKIVSGIAALVLGVSLSAVDTHALTMGICNPDVPGNCSESISLTGNQLQVTLTNTSPVANGGYITAFAFDLSGNASITGVATTDSDFHLTPLPTSTGGSISVAPDGNREFVMSISSQYLGGGNPTDGIGTGQSATFTFTLGGSYAGVTELNVANSGMVRFRGFRDGSSDKDNFTSVPEPATLLLLGTGLAGLGLWRRKASSV